MNTIRKTDEPCHLIVACDFLKEVKDELTRQGIEILEVRRTRSLVADEKLDVDDIYAAVHTNYGHYGKMFGGPTMIVAKGDYDDMLTVARQIAKDAKPTGCVGPVPDYIMDEVNEILEAMEKGK